MSKFCATTTYEPPKPTLKKGRFLPQRLRDKKQWAEENVRTVRPPDRNTGIHASPQQAATDATQQNAETIELSLSDFHPYGWACIWWLLGVWIDYNAYHYLHYFAIATLLIGVIYKRGPHYLFSSAAFLAIGWFLLKYFIPI